MQNTRMWRHFDVWLLAAVAILTIAGVAMIRSAIGGNENLAELVLRQTIYGLIGLVVLFVTAAIDYRLWSALARPLFIFVVAALGLILSAGLVGFGSARWFNVGIATIQPSELSKILMILVLSNYLGRNELALNQPNILIRSLIVMGFPALLVFLQPDLSTAIVLGVIWLALVWAAGAQPKHLAVIAGIALLAPILTWPFLENYQKARVITFLFPNPDAQFGATYNVNQALIAIGSGGLFGQGYSSGTQVQLRFLKVRHTDFIFSAMAEEFGFFGALIFIAVLSFIIIRCIRAARMARDTFGSLICYGIAILLAFQGFFNIAMNLKLLPVSGLPLPFFSYGGSSLLASLVGIGLVESVILRHKQIEL
ncbi:MAG: rod shape-determining protein RodA [Anaerolineales bacterium]|nr:MAG: rod shape-determining protein RodA [Anaerolineales bacterium]